MSALEITLDHLPKAFTVALSGRAYRMRVYYADVNLGGWFLDIADEQGNAMTNGIPLVAGTNLLEQYAYLDMRGKLFVVNDLAPGDMPGWESFPTNAHLVWIPDVQ